MSVLCPGAVDTPILDRLPDTDLPATASRPVTARQCLSLVGQKPVDPNTVARRALAGVDRNKAIIIVPGSARARWYVNRLSPSLLGRLSGHIARRVDRDLVRPQS